MAGMFMSSPGAIGMPYRTQGTGCNRCVLPIASGAETLASQLTWGTQHPSRASAVPSRVCSWCTSKRCRVANTSVRFRICELCIAPRRASRPVRMRQCSCVINLAVLQGTGTLENEVPASSLYDVQPCVWSLDHDRVFAACVVQRTCAATVEAGCSCEVTGQDVPH